MINVVRLTLLYINSKVVIPPRIKYGVNSSGIQLKTLDSDLGTILE